MSGDLIYVQSQMGTEDFINDLKSLYLNQTENEYSVIMERLLIQLKISLANGLTANIPFSMALIDNFYRIIPIFEKKLYEKNENSQQTNIFLQTLATQIYGVPLLDLFLAVKDLSCLEMISQRYFPLLKQDYFTDDKQFDELLNCLLPIISYSSILVPVTEYNLPPNFLSFLLEFTKQNWECPDREHLVNNILSLIKVLSTVPALTSMIIQSKWPNACIEWLRTPGPRKLFKTDFLICLILLKLSRHTIAVEALNQLNCMQALMESKERMKKDHSEEECHNINFLQSITYTLLVEADEIKKNSMLADGLVCDVLSQLIFVIVEASKHQLFVYKGCHISEALCVLSKLCVNDDILRKCLNESSELFDRLCQLLIYFAANNNDTSRLQRILNNESLVRLTNLLWSISFHKSYHEKFRSNTELMQTLSSLATSSSLYTNIQMKLVPRDIASLKKAAESILWNLKPDSHIVLSKEKSLQQPLIMISYSHSDATFCRELEEHLSRHIPVWVDYKHAHHTLHHSDDVWEEIAAAMETATIIVLIISKEYYESKSCRQELSYASDTLKKRILPVYPPNQQYRANGWLGIRIAGQKYVHFGRKMFPDALNELLSMITVDQKSTINISQTPQPAIATEAIVQENTLKHWKVEDIRKWFEDNHIHQDLITLFADKFHTGTSLLVYAHHLKLFYRNEYVQTLANYHKTFNGKRMQTVDFITLVDAFCRLRQEYDPHSKTDDAIEKANGDSLSGGTKILTDAMTWL